MNGVSKLKGIENTTLDLNGNGVKLNMVMPVTTLMDVKSKIALGDISIKQTTNGELAETNMHGVIANNKQYIQVDGGEWQNVDITPDEFAEQFKFNSTFKYDDIICSALNTVNGTKQGEIILKGNIIMGDSITSFLDSQELVDNNISSKSIEITLNKTTNIVSKIVLKVSGITIIDKLKYNFTVNYVINYSDINGSFIVAVPDELK